MDLNELLDAHQRAVMQITGEGSASGKHATRAALYAARIRDLRDGRGSGDNDPDARDTAMTVYAGRSDTGETRPGTGALAIWEGEGGALEVLCATLPPGITMTLRPEYRVGPYAYSDFALALAEHARQQRAPGAATATLPA
ncbi:MAG: hypothetical protein MUF47_14615 [Porphyrobacter sp.]|jgi:hypothetical protein|nr:hypothetical protein [Porphyrobacter sp.]